MYRHILIPTDGSKLAHKGVAHGLALAKAVGARITVLTVEPLFLTEKFKEFKKEWSAQAASVLKGIADEAKAAGVQCETVQTAHGSPDEAILAVAKEKGCDLIIMASHGERGIAGLILGSVTAKVLAQANIPVTVCR
jgi:nucleotide-binding universal stress UspA family protein